MQIYKKCTALNISNCVNEICNAKSYPNDVVQAVKENIIKLCGILVDSNFYHSDGSNCVFADYTPVADTIKNAVQQSETDSEKKKKLLAIIEEIKLMMQSFDFPNVSDKWFQWNPNLKYYDAVFKIHHESPEYFEKIKNGELYTLTGNKRTPIKFNFIPDEEDFRNEKEYRKQLANEKAEEEQYQKEIIRAVEEMFNGL